MIAFALEGTALYLLLAGLALLIAVGADTIGQRLRIPDLIWLILFGIAVGPVLGWISRSAILGVAPVVGTAVLVVILFDAGLDLGADVLRPLLASAVAFSVVTYIASAVIATGLADLFLFPNDPLLSLFFGSALGATSGAVAIPIANRMGLLAGLRGFVHLDAAIEDALAIVFTSILLLLVAPGGGHSSLDVVLVVSLPIPVGIAVGAVGGIVWLLTLSRWQRRAYASLATLGFVLAIYAVAQALHGSGILAALLVGITIANAPLLHRVARWIRVIEVHESLREVQTDLAFMLRALFLFFLGALVELRNPGLLPLLVIGVLSLLLLGLRYGFAALLAHRHRIDFAWGPTIGGIGGRGLTSAVLLLLPLGIVAGADRLFLPGVLTILGTDVVMTVWLSLGSAPREPPPPNRAAEGIPPPPPSAGGGPRGEGRPPLPAAGPRDRPPETV